MIFYLLDRLHCFGISNIAYDWFKHYLSNGHQIVRLGDQYSGKIEVKQCVPQCTAPGPLLFNLYVNEICQMSISSEHF